ncbi:hypothetical protein [Acidobacterium sp. S8]|uniref:hypothetical protein n=1 Tax=Acidobacterium sp. S8 TaxID=1641854 RepID=UPI00131D235F|nr:hypothetical protein [Acidobacterium sp. S8]
MSLADTNDSPRILIAAFIAQTSEEELQRQLHVTAWPSTGNVSKLAGWIHLAAIIRIHTRPLCVIEGIE